MKSVLKVFQITPQIIQDSLQRYTACDIQVDPRMVQEVVDAMARLGYIKRFQASKILDLRWLHNGK